MWLSVARNAWAVWKEALEQKQALNHMRDVALQFLAFRIQAQVNRIDTAWCVGLDVYMQGGLSVKHGCHVSEKYI